jgi:putative N-acetyltransferase (TIGR04045 family)
VLDAIHPWGSAVRSYVCREVTAQVAAERWQIDGYFRLRREIFRDEQGLFSGSDVDEHDDAATAIVALSHIAGMADDVVGVVRIYETSGGTWFGGRLGVSRGYRRLGAVGAALIDTAVSTAHGSGCTRFLATVQADNVRYFERFHFRALEPVSVCGRPHQLMQAELGFFPPRTPQAEVRRRRAA